MFTVCPNAIIYRRKNIMLVNFENFLDNSKNMCVYYFL